MKVSFTANFPDFTYGSFTAVFLYARKKTIEKKEK